MIPLMIGMILGIIFYASYYGMKDYAIPFLQRVNKEMRSPNDESTK